MVPGMLTIAVSAVALRHLGTVLTIMLMSNQIAYRMRTSKTVTC
jgi:hypothetical protein